MSSTYSTRSCPKREPLNGEPGPSSKSSLGELSGSLAAKAELYAKCFKAERNGSNHLEVLNAFADLSIDEPSCGVLVVHDLHRTYLNTRAFRRNTDVGTQRWKCLLVS